MARHQAGETTSRRAPVARRPAAGRGRRAAPLLAAALLLAPLLTSCGPPQAPDPGSTTPDTAAGSPSRDRGDDAAGPGGRTPGTSGDAPRDGDTSDGDTSDDRTGSNGGPAAPDAGNGDQSGTADGGDGSSTGSGGQTDGDGSEVIPAGPGSVPAGGLGEAPVPAAGRLDRDQRTGTADGLVAGFPDDVVRVPPDATVTSSSVTGTDARYQVTLAATVDGGCDPVLLGYRSWFTTGGFAEEATSAGPDGSTVDLARADGTVRVAVTPAPDTCEVTILATLSAP